MVQTANPVLRTPSVPLAKAIPQTPHGIRRARFSDLDEHLVAGGIVLITAPAGSGKTTLASHLIEFRRPTWWCRFEAGDADLGSFLRLLHRSVAPTDQDFASVDDALEAMAAQLTGQGVLVLDDLQRIIDSDAERALDRLVELRPPGLGIVMASRRMPHVNIDRLRVSDRLKEIDADRLRFRPWEAETLYRDWYKRNLGPEEVARLTRATDGWAAGLQLFHLATEGKPASARTKMLDELRGQTRIVRSYLARNLLEGLPGELRRFLIDTSVLGRLTPSVCDALLDRTDSDQLLDEIEERQLLCSSDDDGKTLRCHEVLRVYLEAKLISEIGTAAAASRFRLAGSLLERAGYTADALTAYCRAEDWPVVARMLGRNGCELASMAGEWTALLPNDLRESDPWVVLARARRSAARWDLAEARSMFRRAENLFADDPSMALARAERYAIETWIDSSTNAPQLSVRLLREAARSDPLEAANQAIDDASESSALTAGVCFLLAGDLRRASTWLSEATDAETGTEAGVHTARALAALVARLREHEPRSLALADDVDLTDQPALRAVLSAAYGLPVRPGSEWLSTVCQLVEGVASLSPSDESEVDERAMLGLAETFERLELGVLSTWALAMATVSAATPQNDYLQRAAGRASSRGVPGAALLIDLAAERNRPGGLRVSTGERARQLGVERWLPIGTATDESIRIHCFGSFEIRNGEVPIDLAALKPRHRELLEILAVHAPDAVHRERIASWLWPEAEARKAARRVQVAVSEIRRVLAMNSPSIRWIPRHGEAYRLADGQVWVDVAELRHSCQNGKPEEALELWTGGLLANRGAVPWVDDIERSLRYMAVDAVASAAGELLRDGKPALAARLARRGTEIDSYADQLWRLLIESLRAAGDHAAEAAARHNYDAVLEELGVA